jgi:hypothetical protein
VAVHTGESLTHPRHKPKSFSYPNLMIYSDEKRHCTCIGTAESPAEMRRRNGERLVLR